jgi:hypothetical protein
MPRIKLRYLAAAQILILTIFPATVWGSTDRDDVPDSNYIALGNDPAFGSVGTFVNSWGYTGCGILIAPDWVLTSAHLLLAASSGTFTIGGTAYTSTQLFTDPHWDGNAQDGFDFALMHLDTSLTAVSPALFYDGSSLLGQTCTFVGYGWPGNGSTGAKAPPDGQKRGFQNVVDVNNSGLGDIYSVLGATFDNPTNSNALPLEGCVAPGDSGGGVFVTDGLQFYLAGVISFVASTNGTPNSSYGNISSFDPLSADLSWIMTTVPEPSTVAIMAASGFILAARRKFRRRK